jgi:hypothetical protein
MPKIPAIPDKTGGAGMGNFSNENIKPTTIPVIVAIITSYTCSPSWLLINYFNLRSTITTMSLSHYLALYTLMLIFHCRIKNWP